MSKAASKDAAATSDTIQHAFDVLKGKAPSNLPSLVILLGDDRYLKQLVLAYLDGQLPDSPFDRQNGCELAWKDVSDELATVSLFSSGPRRLFVSEADEFVTRSRSSLESYAEKGGRGILALDLKKLASNTKLYKAIVKSGLIIECKFPQVLRGKKQQPDTAKAYKWMLERAKTHHHIRLSDTAKELLAELVDWNFGRLDQELAKLCLFVEKDGTVDVEMVEKVVGGWRTQTTWDMIDKACDGDAAAAIQQLDHLLQSGESPQALFGSLAWSLRRFAAAARLYEQQEKHDGRRPNMKQVLQDAGFKAWPQDALDNAAGRLKQIGRERASEIYSWLLEADMSLKGSHAAPVRARFVLERLILKLSREAKPARASA